MLPYLESPLFSRKKNTNNCPEPYFFIGKNTSIAPHPYCFIGKSKKRAPNTIRKQIGNGHIYFLGGIIFEELDLETDLIIKCWCPWGPVAPQIFLARARPPNRLCTLVHCLCMFMCFYVVLCETYMNNHYTHTESQQHKQKLHIQYK